jgi:hypothetical protein
MLHDGYTQDTGVNRECHEPGMCPRVIALLIRATSACTGQTLVPHKGVIAQNGKPPRNKSCREKQNTDFMSSKRFL